MSKYSSQTPTAEVWIYDIETFPNLFLLTAKNHTTGEVVVLQCGLGKNDVSAMASLMDRPAATHPHTWFVGYNSRVFDDRVMVWVIENEAYLSSRDGGEVARLVYKKAQAVIKDDSYWVPPHYKFQSIDLMRVTRLHIYRKSLKLVGVNLKWHKIQDLPHHHSHKVSEKELQTVIDYNLNDVLLTEKLFEDQREEVRLRNAISVDYGVDVMSEDRSGVANRLLEKFYGEATGLQPWEFKKLRTMRSTVKMTDVIHSNVRFESKKLQSFLSSLKKVEIHADNLKECKWRLLIGNTVYDVALGGLHSSDDNYPALWESDADGTLYDCDVASYYPRIVLQHRIKPAHLSESYLDILQKVTDERLEAKGRMKELEKAGKTDDPIYKASELKSDAMKIVINSIFGKLGDPKYWLYDPLGMYRVTINGQLYLLMLIERLERAGIPVWYANTDGVTAKVPPGKEALYKEICRVWEAELGFELEYAVFEKALIQNVNKYIIRKEGGKFKTKGDLDDALYEDVTKGFNMPVIATAIREYFFNKKPVLETLRNHPDLLDFCKAQNVGHQYELEYHRLNLEELRLEKEALQRTIRFFVSRQGGSLQKRKKGGRLEALAGTKGQTVYVLNDLPTDPQQLQAVRSLVDYAHYERECNKIIRPFERRQVTLAL